MSIRWKKICRLYIKKMFNVLRSINYQESSGTALANKKKYYLSFIYITQIYHNFGAPGTDWKLRILRYTNGKIVSTGRFFLLIQVFFYSRAKCLLFKQFYPRTLFWKELRKFFSVKQYDQIHLRTWSETYIFTLQVTLPI